MLNGDNYTFSSHSDKKCYNVIDSDTEFHSKIRIEHFVAMT